MSPTFLFVWETLHVPAYGLLKNLPIMVKLGLRGNTFLIPKLIVKFTSERIHSNQLEMTMMLYAQLNSARLYHSKQAKLSFVSSTLVHLQTTISIHRSFKNGRVPQMFESAC